MSSIFGILLQERFKWVKFEKYPNPFIDFKVLLLTTISFQTLCYLFLCF
jgi:hypothetical protein